MTDLESISLLDPAILAEPWDTYRLLRDESPVFFDAKLNLHVVTRYDLIREAIKDTATFSSRFDEFMARSTMTLMAGAPKETQEALGAVFAKMIPLPPTMLTLDEPRHTMFRSLVSRLFTGRATRQNEESVARVVEEHVAALHEPGAEFMQAFANPVPLRIIGDRLGIPPEDRQRFNRGAASAAAQLQSVPLTPEEVLRRTETAVDLQELLVGLLAARRADPRDDMITILATSELDEEKRPLTDAEALSILNQFLVAGHETTSSSFGWGMLTLCRQPELQDRLRGSPVRIRTFIEETLRLESPVQGLPRLVTRDTELGGYPLAAGDYVMLRFGAANRDERQFSEPDSVDLERAKAGMQLAFGSGIHHCIGAPLARQELSLGYLALLESLRDVRLDTTAEPVAVPNLLLRGLPRLDITFRKTS